MHARFPDGFTLAELLIVLCLVALLASIALPNLSSYLQRNRQSDLRHSLQSHLKATRSEAVALAHRVELCGSSNGQQCDQAWAQGWLMRDADSNSVLRFSRQATSDTLHWRGPGPTSQSVVYQANGTTVASNGRFILCSTTGQVLWQLVLNRQGRIRYSDGLENGQSDGELCR